LRVSLDITNALTILAKKLGIAYLKKSLPIFMRRLLDYAPTGSAATSGTGERFRMKSAAFAA
jgi:hypothetical protein